MRFLFLILPPSRLRPASVPLPSRLRPAASATSAPSLSVTHHLSHTTLSHTSFHTQLCRTPSFTHTIFHTQLCRTVYHTLLCHTPSFTHSFVTHNLSHTTLSHTIFHTQLCHTQLCHTHTLFPSHSTLSHRIFHAPSFTYNFVTHHLSHTTWPHTCTLRGRRGTIVRHGRRTCRGRRGTYDTGLAPVALGRRW